MMSKQLEMISLDQLVAESHEYRKFAELLDTSKIEKELKVIETKNNYKGYGIQRLFRSLLLQFMEDLSDRELERYMQDSTAAKWFVGFGLSEETPDYSVFSKLRSRIGTEKLAELFNEMRSQLKKQGYMSESLTFVDASHLVAKASLWEERDKVIKEKYDKLNNQNVSEVSSDKEAKIGAKGKNKFWYGYKKHVSVDMKSGMINKVAVTPANVTDAKGFKHITPRSGKVYADKGYCTRPASQEAKKRGVELEAIKKNNMYGKDKDKDRQISKMRSPYERVFAKQPKRARYRGIAKNQFQEFMHAMCFNLKRLVSLQNSLQGS